MAELVDHFLRQQDAMVAQLQELVEIESPSSEKAAVDRAGAWIAEQMQQAGAAVEILARQQVGDLVIGRWGEASAGDPILLLAHRDTVWPLGTLAERPVRLADGRLYGPGAYDMKAGIILALAALRGLQALGRDLAAPVVMLVTGDEETGSLGSREAIEELAAASRLVLCLEPALPGGGIKTGRKGVGWYTLRAYGRAAHAGGDHQKGINAIEEMAHQVLALQALTDYDRGTTINVGVIAGGTVSNVVPEVCEAHVDLRVERLDEAERVASVIAALTPRLAGVRLEVEGGLDRPPMIRDQRMAETYSNLCSLAERHGLTLWEGSTGGGSDANFTAALGVPTLDGLGADGDGAHATHEHVVLASMPERAALLAAVLGEWS